MRNQVLPSFLILFLALFFVSANVNAQQETKAGEDTALAFTACAPLVRVFDQVICRSDVEQESEHEHEIKQAYKESGLDPASTLRRENRQRLYNKIWNKALKERFDETRLQPSDGVIEAYHNSFKNALVLNYERDKRMIEKVDQKLASESLSDDQRQSLENLKAMTMVSTSYYEKNREFRDNLPPEMEGIMQEAERELVMTQLREFYEDKALFEEFGGALFMIEDRPKPLEAYKDFLLSLDKEVEIIAPEYQRLLSDMAQNFNALLSDMTPIKDEKARAFYQNPMILLDRDAMENLVSQ